MFRQLLYSLTEDDCVSFYNLVQAVKLGVRNDSAIADWVFSKEADILFEGAKARIELDVTDKNGVAKVKQETNPKWNAFCDLIKEIKEETKSCEKVNILVVVREDYTARRLRDVLHKGAEALLEELYESVKAANGDESEAKRAKEDPDESMISENIALFREFLEHPVDPVYNIHYHCVAQDGYVKLEEFLRFVKPWFIVVYDPDMEVIRRIEVYQACFVSPERCKVYFFMFDGSAEEQRYLTSLRKEKEAFEKLIKEKSVMVIPEDRDGRGGYHPDLVRGSQEDVIMQQISTRQGGIQRSDVIMQKVVVDMREFRCELPSLIHKRGIDIEPATIEIGDYVLTPDICVERKSISDLIASLNSGRLYSQVQYMTRHYKTPFLLIEFDEDKPFSLKGKSMGFVYKKQTSTSPEIIEAMPRLVLMSLHFHSLRLIWSPSPHFSAEMFEYLKQGKGRCCRAERCLIRIVLLRATKRGSNSGNVRAAVADRTQSGPVRLTDQRLSAVAPRREHG